MDRKGEAHTLAMKALTELTGFKKVVFRIVREMRNRWSTWREYEAPNEILKGTFGLGVFRGKAEYRKRDRVDGQIGIGGNARQEYRERDPFDREKAYIEFFLRKDQAEKDVARSARSGYWVFERMPLSKQGSIGFLNTVRGLYEPHSNNVFHIEHDACI